MKNQKQNQNQTYESDDYDFEALFCETYDTDDFETALSEFNSELDECTCDSESDDESDDDTFESEDELEVWLEDHQNDNGLLKEGWDSDLWNNSVSELATQSELQFGVLNKAGVMAVLAQWQADWNGLREA